MADNNEAGDDVTVETAPPSNPLQDLIDAATITPPSPPHWANRAALELVPMIDRKSSLVSIGPELASLKRGARILPPLRRGISKRSSTPDEVMEPAESQPASPADLTQELVASLPRENSKFRQLIPLRRRLTALQRFNLFAVPVLCVVCLMLLIWMFVLWEV